MLSLLIIFSGTNFQHSSKTRLGAFRFLNIWFFLFSLMPHPPVYLILKIWKKTDELRL
ncbi:hypothetical protein LEP1GSC048_0667 [Leptospira santarosai serovar Shermani str. 1342KT]|nr:hypothetical protein LEP1GSC048_0667 [Leptospira santarosai serovar Shermani str. 1342KT]